MQLVYIIYRRGFLPLMMTRGYDLIDISDRSAWSVQFLGDRCMPGVGIIERSQKDLDALTFDLKQCEKHAKLDQFAGSWMRRNVNKKYHFLGNPARSVRRGRSYDAADVLARAAEQSPRSFDQVRSIVCNLLYEPAHTPQDHIQ
jgi:hypothetical protein